MTGETRWALSYGLGVDWTAVLLCWLFEPETRPAPPGE